MVRQREGEVWSDGYNPVDYVGGMAEVRREEGDRRSEGV